MLTAPEALTLSAGAQPDILQETAFQANSKLLCLCSQTLGLSFPSLQIVCFGALLHFGAWLSWKRKTSPWLWVWGYNYWKWVPSAQQMKEGDAIFPVKIKMTQDKLSLPFMSPPNLWTCNIFSQALVYFFQTFLNDHKTVSGSDRKEIDTYFKDI